MKDFSQEKLEQLHSYLSSDISDLEKEINDIKLFDYDGVYGTDLIHSIQAYAGEFDERNYYAVIKLRQAFENVWEAECKGSTILNEVKEQLKEYNRYVQGLVGVMRDGRCASLANTRLYVEGLNQKVLRTELFYTKVIQKDIAKNSTQSEINKSSYINDLKNLYKKGLISEKDYLSNVDKDVKSQDDILDRAENLLINLGYTPYQIALLRNNYATLIMSLYITNCYSSTDYKIIKAQIDQILENEKYLVLPREGDTITVSYGIDLPEEERIVASRNAWSIEYTIDVCNRDYSDDLCCRRLNYALDNYPNNQGEVDLLKFTLEGYDEPVYAGAMVEGYADIGDIVLVQLDNGEYFYFLILEVKHIEHTSSQLDVGQIQCEYGHGYDIGDNKVQLSVCEFIMTDNPDGVGSAIHTESGAFLKGRSVTSCCIVDHIDIKD